MAPARATKTFPYDGTVRDLFTGEPTLPTEPPKKKPKKERPEKERPDRETLNLDLRFA